MTISIPTTKTTVGSITIVISKKNQSINVFYLDCILIIISTPYSYKGWRRNKLSIITMRHSANVILAKSVFFIFLLPES